MMRKRQQERLNQLPVARGRGGKIRPADEAWDFTPSSSPHIKRRPQNAGGFDTSAPHLGPSAAFPEGGGAREAGGQGGGVKEGEGEGEEAEGEGGEQEGEGGGDLRGGTGGEGTNATEVGGFVGSILTVIVFCMYLVWAYVPEASLHSMGITYYPSKYWAIAVPTYVVATLVFTQVVYAALNHMHTPSPDSLLTVYDEYARERPPLVSPQHEEPPDARTGVAHRQPIPPIYDVPLIEINDLLFGPSSEYAKSLLDPPGSLDSPGGELERPPRLPGRAQKRG